MNNVLPACGISIQQPAVYCDVRPNKHAYIITHTYHQTTLLKATHAPLYDKGAASGPRMLWLDLCIRGKACSPAELWPSSAARSSSVAQPMVVFPATRDAKEAVVAVQGRVEATGGRRALFDNTRQTWNRHRSVFVYTAGIRPLSKWALLCSHPASSSSSRIGCVGLAKSGFCFKK